MRFSFSLTKASFVFQLEASGQQPMRAHVGKAPDWGGEVCVDVARKPVVPKVLPNTPPVILTAQTARNTANTNLPRHSAAAEIHRLHHASCCHDADERVKVGESVNVCAVERL